MIRFHPSNRTSPVLESDGVRGQDYEASTSGRWPKGLKSVAHVAGHLPLSEVELPIVLVKHNNSAERVATFRREQESRNDVTFESSALDCCSVEAVGLLGLASLELNRHWVRKR